MALTCPQCKGEIAADDVNVAKDVAFCRACGKAWELSELVRGVELGTVSLEAPPRGAWYRDDGVEVVVGATSRSTGAGCAALGIMLFWNGVVSVFFLVVLSATIQHLGWNVPHWFPAPNMNGAPMSVGLTIFMWLFLSPFLLIGAAMVWAFFYVVFGRVEVRVRGTNGEVFRGIGVLGSRRRFDASRVQRVVIEEKRSRDSDGNASTRRDIVLTGEEEIRFGSMLQEERKRFVGAALRKILCG